jgi:hypothetical protein
MSELTRKTARLQRHAETDRLTRRPAGKRWDDEHDRLIDGGPNADLDALADAWIKAREAHNRRRVVRGIRNQRPRK